MSVSLVSSPLQLPLFNPSGGNGACFKWCISENELEVISGTKAVFTLTVTDGPLSGSLQIAGKTFTVNNLVTDYTSSEFVDEGDALITATNLMNAVKSNIDIYPYWDFEVAISGPNAIFTMTSKVVGYIAPTPFSSAGIGLSSTFTQGIPLVLKSGYKYAYQLIMIEPDGNEVECMQIQTIKPRYNYRTGSEEDLCFDLINIASAYVKTQFPSSNPDAYQWDQTAMRRFYIRYGFIDRIGCNTVESSFRNDFAVNMVNHSASLTQLSGPVGYSPDPFSGSLQTTKLMTARNGIRMCLCPGSYAWVYGYFNGVVTPQNYHLSLYYVFYDKNFLHVGQTFVANPMASMPGGYSDNGLGSNGVFIIPVGPGNLPTGVTYPAGTHFVVVQIGKTLAGSEPSFVQMYEEYYYYVDESCGCTEVEMYFLCQAGGYDTITFNKIKQISLDTDQIEVTFRDFCRDFQDVENYQRYLAETGKDQYRTVARRRYTVTTGKFPNDEKHREFIEQFITSEHRLLRVNYEPGQFLAQKVNIIHSEFILERDKGYAKYEVTFELAHSLTPVSER